MRELLMTVDVNAMWYALFVAEAYLVLAIVRRARSPRAAPKYFAPIERFFSQLAGRKSLAIAVCGLAPVVLRLGLLPIVGVRAPWVSDEFSYLLAADTFASGRLTNPTHPMWMHFETLHVNQHPTYMSMYPPLQGMLLAAGLLVHSPWIAVLASVGVMCATLCWMLQGWFPARWAFLGAMIAAMRLGIFSYWANSYWGGALAATGGALVLGALPRIFRFSRARDGVWLALGLGMLATTRPYEGMFVAAPACIALGVFVVRRRAIRVAASVLVVGSLAVAALGAYDHAVTGSALRMPYQVNRATYVTARYFVWESKRPAPVYRTQSLADYYLGWQAGRSDAAMTITGFPLNLLVNARDFWIFFIGPILTLPLLAIRRVLRSRRLRLLWIVGAVLAFGCVLDLWFYAHYVSPGVCILYALIVQGMRHLRLWRPGGLFLVRAIPSVCVAMLILRTIVQPFPEFLGPENPPTWYWTRAGNVVRQQMQSDLERTNGRHLVMVRYSPDHDPLKEWVYNRADIDASSVVWAHAMTPTEDAELIRYYPDRKVWLVEPDRGAKLLPYPE